MDVAIESLTVIRGNTYVSVNIISSQAFSNVITRIWFTLIFMHVPSFTEQVSTYTGRELYALYPSGTTPNISNFRVPSVFNIGYFNDECVFSLIKILADPTNLTHEINYREYSTSTISNISSLTSQNSLQARYQIFCMQNCSADRFVTIWAYDYCGVCWGYSASCLLCTYANFTYTFTCLKCFSNFYLFFNVCQGTCPVGYYGDQNTTICTLCNSICYSCSDGTNCLSCRVGWPVQGGCTTMDGCLIAASSTNCSKCSAEGKFELVGSSCKCIEGYFLVTHLCTNIIGCISATISQGKTICMSCSSMKNFVLSNDICVCKESFVFNGKSCI